MSNIMYKGCKNKRSYVNKNIFAVGSKVYGAEQMATEIEKLLKELDPSAASVSKASDKTATTLLSRIIEDARHQTNLLNEAKLCLGEEKRASEKQRRTIIAITQYKLKWKPEGTFNWIIARVPEVKVRMAPDDVNNSWLKGLYDELSASEANHIIQCLRAFEKSTEKKKN